MSEKGFVQTSALAEKQWQRYCRARDAGHLEYIQRAESYQDYYLGNQWDEAVRKQLEEEGRPALTINLILSTINAALGEYTNRQVDLNYKAKKGGSFDVATVLTKLGMHTLEQNHYDAVEWDLMMDGLISERGYLEVKMDWSEHMEGEVSIKAIDPSEVVLDPDAKEYDPSTWTEVTRTYWESLDEIEANYGKEKREQVAGLVASAGYYSFDSVEFERRTFGDAQQSEWEYGYGEAADRNIKSVRVLSRQYKKLVKGRFFLDPRTGDLAPVPQGRAPEEVQALADALGIEIIERPTQRIRWTVTVDKVVLHDEWSPYNSFSIIPYFPFFMRGRPFGMVRNLMGSQDYLNKITSQELHVVNTTANSGWTAEEGTLVNMTEDEFAERGAETGLVLIHTRGSEAPKKIQPNPIPTGLELLSNKSRQYLREISGLEGVLGIASPEISGVALEGKQSRANVQLQVPFKNLARTRQLLGNKLLELFQQFYTEERIIHITRDLDPEEPEEELAINQPTPEGRIANDITKGKYSAVVGTQPSRDNFDDTQFAEAFQMREAGVAIPDSVLIRYSRLADKKAIMEQVEKLQGMAQPTDQEIEMMQMEQQLAIQTGMAELDKLVAEAEQIRSQAHLNVAKAEEAAGSGEVELQKLEAKIQEKREELQTRMQLAAVSKRQKEQQQAITAATQLAQARYQGETQREIAELNARRNSNKGK